MKASEFVKQHPICCFCGGREPATTIEHMPARIAFPKKHRPKGMEFPSCDICNIQTSGDDALLGLIARTAGSMRTTYSSADDKALAKAAGGIRTKFPELKFKGYQDWACVNDVMRKVGFIDVNHPQINESLCRLAAKIALAVYYNETGKIATETFRLNTMWTHNQKEGADKIAKILGMFPQSTKLTQGKWDTSESFFVRHIMEDDSLITAAIIHESICLYAELGSVESSKSWIPMQATWAPTPGVGIGRCLPGELNVR